MADEDDIQWEIEFFEGIIAQSPDCADVLKVLGNLYTQDGRHAEGLAVDLRLVRLEPEDPTVHYNLACSLSLVGNLDAAIFSLRRAIELGYREVDWMREDTDLDNLRTDPRYAELERAAKKQQDDWQRIIAGQ